MTALLIEFSEDDAIQFLRDMQHRMRYSKKEDILVAKISGQPLQNVFLAALYTILPPRLNEPAQNLSNISAGYDAKGVPVNFDNFNGPKNGLTHEYKWKYESTRGWIDDARILPKELVTMRFRDEINVEGAGPYVELMRKAGLEIKTLRQKFGGAKGTGRNEQRDKVAA